MACSRASGSEPSPRRPAARVATASLPFAARANWASCRTRTVGVAQEPRQLVERASAHPLGDEALRLPHGLGRRTRRGRRPCRCGPCRAAASLRPSRRRTGRRRGRSRRRWPGRPRGTPASRPARTRPPWASRRRTGCRSGCWSAAEVAEEEVACDSARAGRCRGRRSGPTGRRRCWRAAGGCRRPGRPSAGARASRRSTARG